MDQIQITLIQIDNYGPWTETLGPDREARLQVLQAELYAFLQKEFSSKGALVFYNRFDEMVAVTNGVPHAEHAKIASKIEKRFPVTVSMGIGIGGDAFSAASNASAALRSMGGAQSPSRRSAVTPAPTLTGGRVEIAHLDVKDITRLTDTQPFYSTSNLIVRLHLELAKKFGSARALLFYLGGDNFMGVSTGLPEEFYSKLCAHLADTLCEVRVSVASAPNARLAAEHAARGLDRLRKDGADIHISGRDLAIREK